MAFYASISGLYEFIFPYSPHQKSFVIKDLSHPEEASLLEIGCAAGSLTLELAKDCGMMTGIDIDGSMISHARLEAARTGSDARILQMDMLDIADHFTPKSFDAVCCFGNTLVHLEDRQQMLQLLRAVKALLKERAGLHIQIINYDRILDERVTSLPTVDNEFISFERSYRYLGDAHRIEFSTRLTDKASGAASTQEVLLYPLRKLELQDLLAEAGFISCEWYGSFDRSPLTGTSIPLIVSAH